LGGEWPAVLWRIDESVEAAQRGERFGFGVQGEAVAVIREAGSVEQDRHCYALAPK
jgi:hypothetical protein